MNDTPSSAKHPPPELLEVLAESDADFAAGRVVPGDVAMRDLRDGLARLEAKASAAKCARKDAAGR
ncbi:hypothetical protein [Rhodopila globiformis]|uniref:hypothetical protein n=1 Tax=Rhodopila globiformis TaxID=1071 RepID=UPI0011AFD7F2|nr:hypothetical protein [Rhodopila globiformis]